MTEIVLIKILIYRLRETLQLFLQLLAHIVIISSFIPLINSIYAFADLCTFCTFMPPLPQNQILSSLLNHVEFGHVGHQMRLMLDLGSFLTKNNVMENVIL